MMLLGSGGLLKDVTRNLCYSDWSGGLPFQWNETLNILERKTQKQLRSFSIRLGVATLYFILALIQTSRVLNKASLMVITHRILVLAGMAMMLCNDFANFLQLSGVVQLCNGFIQLEQNISEHFGNTTVVHGTKSISKDLFIRGMLYLLTFTGFTVPILCFVDILRNPCFPAFAGYLMSSQCEDNRPGYYLMPTWSVVEILTKVAMSFGAYFIWSPLIAGGVFQQSLAYIVEGNCFRVFIGELGK